MLNILQSHYPERMGLALVINIPMIVNAFFKLVMPFVDPVTRAKVRFNPAPVADGLLAPEQTMQQWWGGDLPFEYVHDKYWPALIKMCDERGAEWRARWHELGAEVGVSEWEYKGGDLGAASVDTTEKLETGVPLPSKAEAGVEVNATEVQTAAS